MTSHAQAKFEQALAVHQQGQLALAQELYEAVLAAQPGHFDALHLLGVIAAQTSNHQRAVELIDRAIELRPDNAAFYINRGNALQALRHLDAAVASYDRAIALNPGIALAFCNRGNALKDMKRQDAAIASYERAIALKPDYAVAFGNRGAALQELGQLDAAIASYTRAIALKPDYAEAFCSRGNALQEQKKLEAAMADYERAIALKPNYPEAFFNRGNALKELKRNVEAVASYERAIAEKPDSAEAYLNRGNALRDIDQSVAAIESYERAIALRQNYAEAFYNRGIAQQELRQFDAAIASYERATVLKPDFGEAYWNQSRLLLMKGDFANGWKLFEWRWKAESLKLPKRNFPQPLWLGHEPIAGKTVLVYAEQGLGDTIQFCRYARLVAQRGARVILDVPEPLLSLLANIEGVVQVTTNGNALPHVDYQCPLLSLPLALKTELASIPASPAYLRADPAKKRAWKERLGDTTKLRVGLVWAGGYRPDQPEVWRQNKRRNVELSKLALLKDERVEFFSLQKGARAEADLAALKQQRWDGPEIVDYTAEFADFSDTAALADNLDLVISVDTSTAHLAAALGKPVWALLAYEACWRWLLERDDSPWYPTVKLYRQERAEDWDSVLARVKADLERLCAPD